VEDQPGKVSDHRTRGQTGPGDTSDISAIGACLLEDGSPSDEVAKQDQPQAGHAHTFSPFLCDRDTCEKYSD